LTAAQLAQQVACLVRNFDHPIAIGSSQCGGHRQSVNGAAGRLVGRQGGGIGGLLLERITDRRWRWWWSGAYRSVAPLNRLPHITKQAGRPASWPVIYQQLLCSSVMVGWLLGMVVLASDWPRSSVVDAVVAGVARMGSRIQRHLPSAGYGGQHLQDLLDAQLQRRGQLLRGG